MARPTGTTGIPKKGKPEKEKHTKRQDVRLTPVEMAELDLAATLSGVAKAEIMRTGGMKEARRIVEEQG